MWIKEGLINAGIASLARRDAKIAKLKTRLSLAQVSRNRQEITRITLELKRLGYSW